MCYIRFWKEVDCIVSWKIIFVNRSFHIPGFATLLFPVKLQMSLSHLLFDSFAYNLEI